MKNKIVDACFGIIICLIAASLALPAIAQQSAASQPDSQSKAAGNNPESPTEETTPPGQVTIGGRHVLTIYDTVMGRTPEVRAAGIEQRIIDAAKNSAISTETVHIEPHQFWTEILIGNEPIMAVTDSDAKMAGGTRAKIAAEWAANIRDAMENYRREHSWPWILRAILNSVLLTLALVPALWLVRRLRLILRDRVQKRIRTSALIEQKSAWQLSVAYTGPILLGLGAILRWIVILAVIEVYLTVILGFFSSTRQISIKVTEWVFSQLSSLSQSGLDYLPNLIVLSVIALVVYYLLRLIRLIFGEVAKGELKIQGFYPDWAEPTEKLVRVLVLVLALIVAFPYLPGAKSPAFQGISIFVGLLLSLGSSSAVANAIAGIILTYMRSFLVGDWVQVGETTGEVIEKTLLVTRILTPKAEIITIPNSTVMSGSVKNYSVEARKAGVIFYTKVTIGYDAPWRTVHQLLINAALATRHVLRQPEPFVLQNALNDFYVAYELNAYTDTPREALNIYSELHQNIQDKFNEAGVEICSPHFASLRDGNTIAIPENYIPRDYEGPGFRLEVLDSGKGKGKPLAPDSLSSSAEAD